MAGSRDPIRLEIDGLRLYSELCSPRTPGPLGYLDAGDPDVAVTLGDTPGPLGVRDYADPAAQRFRWMPPLNFEDSPEYKVFEEIVLNAQVKKAERRGRHRVTSIPDAELDVVEGKFKLRKYAAKKCRALLLQARTDLAKEQAEFLKKPKSDQEKEKKRMKANGEIPVTAVKPKNGVGITSAYRSFEYDRALWQAYVRQKYYPMTYSERSMLSCWEGGQYGWKATESFVNFISKRKAAPGFSNHTNGIAVDFFTIEDSHRLQAETGKSNDDLKRLNHRWEKSWLYRWLQKHKKDYGIDRIETEAWHWEFK